MERHATPRGTESAKIGRVIITKSLRGSGSTGDPCRVVIQYWSLKGEFLAEYDCVTENGRNSNSDYYDK